MRLEKQEGQGVSVEVLREADQGKGELMFGERTDFFQIWFEPDLKKSLREAPGYADVEADGFSIADVAEGVRMKQVIGGEGPVKIDAPVVAGEAFLAEGARHSFLVPEGQALAMFVIDGGWGSRASRWPRG